MDRTNDEDLLTLVDPSAPETWPEGTLVLRGGNEDAVALAEKQETGGFGGWSVQSAPMVAEEALAHFIPNNRYRATTVGDLRATKGKLAYTPDGELVFHCDAYAMSPEAFDAALGPARDNPIPRKERYKGQR